MKIYSTLLFSALSLLFSTSLSAQTAGDYRSNVDETGLWSNASSWQRFDGTAWAAATTPPSAGNGIITIQDGDSIQLTSATTLDQVRIQNGGILSIFDLGNPSPKTVFSLNNVDGEEDMQVAGRLYISVGVQLTGTGSIGVAADGLLFLRRQGILGVATTVHPSGGMYIDEDPTLQSTLTNNGTVTWIRNNFRLVNGTVINNAAFTLLSTGNAVIANDAGTNFFHNTATGILTRAAAGGTLFINAPFKNEGIIRGAGAIEVNSSYINTGIYAPGNTIGKLTIDPTAFTPSATNIMIDIADSFATKGGNDTLHITGAGTYNLSNTTLTVTGSAYAPLNTVYTIMTTTGTFAGSLKSAAFPEYFGALTVNPKSVTIKKIKAGPAVVVWDTITATAVNGQVRVNWTTAQEVATTVFNVEHSLNGTDFTTIGTVNAAGNSSVASNYTFMHVSPNAGEENYYRIRHTGAANEVTYSPIATVQVNRSGAAVTITPNPVRSILYLDVQSDSVTITATNSAGQTVHSWQFGQGRHRLNVNNLAAGVYYFSIYKNGKKVALEKIQKL
jgi:hypothetical protein